MGVWSIAKYADTADSRRFDAEHFRPEYLDLHANMSSMNTLGEYAAQIIHPPEFPRIYSNSGWEVLRAQNVRPLRLSFEGKPVYLPNEIAINLPSNRVESGDILLTRTGANFGQCSLFSGEKSEIVATSHTFIIRTNNLIDSAYLALYLNTKQGRMMLDWGRYGSSQPEIAPRFIRRIRVPRFPEEERALADSVRLAYLKKAESVEHYLKAKQLLMAELDLDKLRFKKPIGYLAKFSEVSTSLRFDSEHFYPEFETWLKASTKKNEMERLRNELSFNLRGRQPGYGEDGHPVINSRHVQVNRVSLELNRFANPSSPSLTIRNGDLLLNGTGRGTLGRAAPYLDDRDAVPDNHVTILRPKEIDPVFLSYFLNCPIGQMQVEMHQRGSSGQLELYPNDIGKFLVWKAPACLQQEVRRLHLEGREKEQESKRLLEQAKTRVEQLIEEAIAS